MKTFIVRVWTEQDYDTDLRGTVHDVESGDRSTFQSPDELIELLGANPIHAEADTRER